MTTTRAALIGIVGSDRSALAARLRTLRKQRNMSQEALAAQAGLTKGFLSQIERGSKDPSISTLVKLAHALGMPISKLFEDPRVTDVSYCVVRRTERKAFARQGTLHGYEYEAVAHKKLSKKMEPFVAYLPKNPPKEYFQHTGEEMLFVLAGHVGLYLNESYIELEEGDCAYFDASVPHHSFSRGQGRAKVLIVVTPD